MKFRSRTERVRSEQNERSTGKERKNHKKSDKNKTKGGGGQHNTTQHRTTQKRREEKRREGGRREGVTDRLHYQEEGAIPPYKTQLEIDRLIERY